MTMDTDVKKIKIAVNGGIGFGAKLNAKQLYDAVDQLIATYAQQGKKREPFHKYVARVGHETIMQDILA